MEKSSSLVTSFVTLVLNNTNIASIGDATGLRGSSSAGVLYFALHTNDPGEAGNQTSNEISYTGYARVSKNRNSTDFTITGNAVAVNSNVDFGTMTAGSGGTATHWSIGTDSSGNGVLLYKGALSPTIVVANGVTPRISLP